jgi:hypothetical protein
MKLVQWVRELRSELLLADVIDIVSARVRTSNSEDHHVLAGQLESLLSEAGRYSEALQVLDEMIEPIRKMFVLRSARLHCIYIFLKIRKKH